MIPFTDAGLLDILHRKARVLEEDFTETGIKLLVEMEQPLLNQFQKFLVK